MSQSRREFLSTAGAAGGLMAAGALVPGLGQAAQPSRPTKVGPADRRMRILILGGTGFTGPNQVRYAVERGHHVTVFNRGRRQADLPRSVAQLVGDRDEPQGLAALTDAVARGTRWDVVIDNPTTLPFWVRDAGQVLAGATNHYIFISTISVYADNSVVGMDETTPVHEYDGDPLSVTSAMFRETPGPLFGPMKAASEREAERWFPGRATIIRPGLIVGPGDRSARFTYWPVRLARGGEVAAPGGGLDPVQFIDARDLAEWTVRVAEARATGVFNATGPAGTLTMAEMLGGIRGALEGTAPIKLTWIPAAFLESQGVRPWSDMPVWVPSTPDQAGFSAVSNGRALAQGLTFRPLATTAADTLTWFRGLPEESWFQSLPPESQAWLGGPLNADPDREHALLEAWHQSR